MCNIYIYIYILCIYILCIYIYIYTYVSRAAPDPRRLFCASRALQASQPTSMLKLLFICCLVMSIYLSASMQKLFILDYANLLWSSLCLQGFHPSRTKLALSPIPETSNLSMKHDYGRCLPCLAATPRNALSARATEKIPDATNSISNMHLRIRRLRT